MAEIDGQSIRQSMLRVIDKIGDQRYMQSREILDATVSELGSAGRRDKQFQQAVLTVFYDMFRIGLLAWGSDFSNSDPPFFHVTEQGREALKHLSRDPANPDGYLNQPQLSEINTISLSYIREALSTYNSNCFKAAAVMVGAAAESLVLELRDIIIESGIEISQGNEKKIKDWRIKTVLDTIGKVLESQKAHMQTELKEKYQAYWPAFTQQIRATRNEAGHPSSIEPVTYDIVHASLLIFPELALLVNDLKLWAETV